MELTNKALRDLVIAHRSDPSLQLNPLSMKISGIVDAAVMGGVTNYEKVSSLCFMLLNICMGSQHGE
jgi:dedicator of cytokinesis protein 1